MKALRLAVLLPLVNLVWAHDGEPGKWELTEYSEDQSCANVVYVRLDGGYKCPKDVDVSCYVDKTDEGKFHMSAKDGCVTDIPRYLKTAFKEAPYFMLVETDSEFCSDDANSSRVMGFLADGKCHPYQRSGHFIVEKDADGTVSALLTRRVAIQSPGTRLWPQKQRILGKAYLINDNSSTITTATGKSGSSAVRSITVALDKWCFFFLTSHDRIWTPRC